MEGATEKFTGDEACRIYLQAAIVYERVRTGRTDTTEPLSSFDAQVGCHNIVFFLVYAKMDVRIRGKKIDNKSNYDCQETFDPRRTYLAYRLVKF